LQQGRSIAAAETQCLVVVAVAVAVAVVEVVAEVVAGRIVVADVVAGAVAGAVVRIAEDDAAAAVDRVVEAFELLHGQSQV
jgi:hypothetical protein